MKNLVYVIMFFMTLTYTFVNAQQCLIGGCLYLSGTHTPYPSAIITAPSTSFVAFPGNTGAPNNMNAGNYTLFNVVEGNTYEWSYCESHGGVSTAWDAQLTLYSDANLTAPLCFSTDVCGLLAPYISWKATFTGTVRLLTTAYINGSGCKTNSGAPYNRLVWRSVTPPNCVTWQNGQPTNPEVLQAAEYLCQRNITEKVIDASTYSFKKAALSTLKALFNGNPPASFISDNYPTLYTDLPSEPNYYQAMMAMLFLDYQDGRPCITRDFNQVYPNSMIYQGYTLRMLFEAWNISPDNTGWNPLDHSPSSFASNIYKDDVNYGYFRAMASIPSLANGYFVSGSFDFTSQKIGEFYLVMLYRLLTQFSHPAVNDTQFYTPNNFQKSVGSIASGIEKSVFNTYEQSGMSLPSGGLGLDFSYSYHSDWIDMPFLPNSIYTSGYELLKQIKAKYKLYPLGLGWTHSYNTFAQVLRDESGNEVFYLFRWGNGDVFLFNAQQMQFETKGIYDKIVVTEYSNGKPRVFTYTTKNQIQYLFLRDGFGSDQFVLYQVIDRNGNRIDIGYENASCSVPPSNCINSIDRRIKSVTDGSSNRSLNFTYQSGTDLINSVSDGTRTLYFNVNPTTLNLDSFTDAKSQMTTYAYCGQENCKNLLISITRPKGNTITNTYAQRKLTTSTNNNYTVNVAFTPTYQAGTTSTQSVLSVNQNGQTINTTYTHDANGNIKSVASKTANINYNYGDSQNPALPTSIYDGNTQITETFSYDSKGNILNHSKSAPGISGTTESFLYDPLNNLTKHTDAMGRVTNFTYDARGNLTDKSGPIGDVTHFDVSTTGLINYTTNPAGLKTTFGYNNYGNLNLVQKDIDANNKIISRADYDNLSRIISTTNPKGVQTTYQYDANDNITKVTDGLNYGTNYSFDRNDNLIAITNARGNTTTLMYDFSTDDLTQEAFGSFTKNWTYNTDGTTKSFTNKKGDVFNYQYYPQNDPREGLLQNDGYASYDYNTNTKQLSTVTRISNGKTLSYTYDAFMRVIQIAYNDFSTNYVQYSYDNNNNVTRITYPGGKAINYEYDANNRLLKITDWQGRIPVQYSYLPDGRLQSETYGNNTSVLYHYDAAGRLDSLANKKANGALIGYFAAKMDLTGNITKETRNEPENVAYPNLTAISSSYTNDATNRLTKVDNTSISNDNNGNQTVYGSTTNTWDIRDRLLNVQSSTGNLDFEYDPLGNRRKKNNTRYVLDLLNNANVLMETDLNGNPTALYIHGLGLVCRLDIATNQYSYYHYDMRGSTTAITDATGQNIIHKYTYGPFGENLQATEAFSQPFRYIGKYGVMYDAPNLQFMRARYYNPLTGRFLSEDPVWSTNLYPYADNNPISNIDPNGLQSNNPFTFVGSWNGLTQSIKSGDIRGAVLYNLTLYGNVANFALDFVSLGRAGMAIEGLNTFVEEYYYNSSSILDAGVAVVKDAVMDVATDKFLASIKFQDKLDAIPYNKGFKKLRRKYKIPYIKASKRDAAVEIFKNGVTSRIKKLLGG